MLPMRIIKAYFRGWFFYPALWSLVTLLFLLVHQFFVAALFCSLTIFLLITRTIPSILHEITLQEILAGRYLQAEKFARFGIEWCKIFFIGQPLTLPRSISFDYLFKEHLSAALMITGKFSDAIKVDREVLVELEQNGDTSGAANTRCSLALCYCWLGDLKEAADLIWSTITILEAVERNAVQAGELFKDVYTCRLAYAFHVQATLLEKKRNYAQAEVVARKAMQTLEKAFDDSSFEMSSHFVMLGTMLIHLKRYDEAEAALMKALTVRQSLLPPGHPLLDSVNKSLGRLYCETDRLELAEPLLRRALTALLALKNNEHPDIPEYKFDLARLLIKQKNFSEAEELLSSALEQRARQSNQNHPDLVDLLMALAEIANAGGDTSRSNLLIGRAEGILATLA